MDKTWANWLSEFLIYAGVIVQEQPSRGAELFQYLDIVYKAYSCFAGGSWLQYDEEFRMHATRNSALAWDQMHSMLWLQIMTGTRALVGDRSHNGYKVQCIVVMSASSCLVVGWPVQPRKSCCFCISVLYVVALTLSELVPGASHISPSENEGGGGAQILKLVKGPSSLNLRVFSAWLEHYPKCDDARYLQSSFWEGFWIPVIGERRVYLAGNLKLVQGMEHIVREKLPRRLWKAGYSACLWTHLCLTFESHLWMWCPRRHQVSLGSSTICHTPKGHW